MARKTTIRAFDDWALDDRNIEAVLKLIAGGLTLQKAALEVKQPYTCLHPWFHSTQERRERYDAARKAWADLKQDEAMAIVDGVKPDRGSVAKAKLQAEVRQNQAAAYAPDRWGQRLHVKREGGAPADEKLLGFASDLLKLVKQREPRIIEPGQVEAGSSPTSVALPAPAAK